MSSSLSIPNPPVFLGTKRVDPFRPDHLEPNAVGRSDWLFHSLCCGHYRKLQISRVLTTAIDRLPGLDEILVGCLEDIGNEFLRIPIDYREPAALDLDHQLMTLSKAMIDLVEVDDEFFHFARHQGFRMRKAFSEPAAEHFHGYRKLKSAHPEIILVIIGVNVDQLYNPIHVRARRTGKQMRPDIPGYRQIFPEWVHLKTQHVRPGGEWPLVFDLPGPPSAAPSIRCFNGKRPVGNRMGRIARVADSTLA